MSTGASAHQVAAQAVIERARTEAAAVPAPAAAVTAAAATHATVAATTVDVAPAREPGSARPASPPAAQFDGPAWATTEPMPGIAPEPAFADTMPAEMPFAPTNFAPPSFAATSFASTNFADTMPAEMDAGAPPRR